MQVKSLALWLLTASAVVSAPAASQAAAIPLEPAGPPDFANQPANAAGTPVGLPTGSSSVTALGACLVESISAAAAGGLDCLNGDD